MNFELKVSDSVNCEFCTKSGDLTLGSSGEIFTLRGFSRLVTTKEDEDCAWEKITVDSREMTFFKKSHFADYTLSFRADSGDTLVISIQGKAKRGFENERLQHFRLEEVEPRHIFIHGQKMGGCLLLQPPFTQGPAHSSHFFTMVKTGSNHLYISNSIRQRNLCVFKVEANGAKAAIQSAQDISASAGDEFYAEKVSICFTAAPFCTLEQYAERNKTVEKQFGETFPVGWNSWDYYRWTITEDEVIKNAEFIAKDPVLSRHVKTILVDDGWQYCYGEWEANCKFPSGMESLAKRLNGLGFQAGLWFAPLIVENHAFVAQQRPDLLAMDERGVPLHGFSCMERSGFFLDPTVEENRKYLYDLFKRYRGYGYTCFKLDFLSYVFAAHKFHDASVSRGDIMRKIVSPIRDAVGRDATILGCNYSFEAGNDLVDAVRVSSDIHAHWHNIKGNSVAIAARFWCHKRLWHNDPDFALARGRDTAGASQLKNVYCNLVYNSLDSKRTAQGLLNTYDDMGVEEAKVLLSLVLVSGGNINLSDDLTALNDKGLDLIRRAVRGYDSTPGVPLDLFESEFPEYWLQSTAQGKRLLLINWDDKPQKLGFDLHKHGVSSTSFRDFWTDELIDATNGKLVAELPKRSCLFVSSSTEYFRGQALLPQGE